MPTSPTYPGVYLERLSSGVRSISGVSTSVAAFIGEGPRGQLGVAKRVLNFSDFERAFGGLSAEYELGYAVRQFFGNGGSEAWIVRVAANPVNATRDLRMQDNSTVALTVTALDAGPFGDTIQVWVDWNTISPDSTFNLTFIPTDTPDAAETYSGLSMNSFHPRYAVTTVNGASKLVTLTRASGLTFTTTATSKSGDLPDVQASLTSPAGQPLKTDFQVEINGLPPIRVSLTPGDLGSSTSNNTRLSALATAIQTKVRNGSTNPTVQQFTAVRDGSSLELRMPAAEAASVRVLPGDRNDASAALGLGVLNGGREKDSAGTLRPRPIPDAGTLTGAALNATDLNALPAADSQAIQLILDGGVAEIIDIGSTAATGNLAAKLQDIAQRLQSVVRARRTTTAFREFVAEPGSDKLVLRSGSRGTGSSVQVLSAQRSGGGDDPLAAALGLITGATGSVGLNTTLQGGRVDKITNSTTYSSYIPAGSDRRGIFALDGVEIFNLMVLPGVTDSATLSDAAAYCEKRRAFLIADAPFHNDIGEMEKLIKGPGLPKSINAAVYYPYIKISDPLNGGKERVTPPSGTIAGVYARTDTNRGVWKAPAGTDASLTGCIGVQYALTDDQNGVLNPLGVNCIRSFPIFGIVSWGARTLRGSNEEAHEYKYVPVSRMALFLEESLFRGLKWVVFEPNDEPLWGQIRLNVGAFLHGLFRQSAFAGRSARDAYFVKCDSETTTETDKNLGRVNIIVGFAPLKPAEFVIIKLQQMAGQSAT